MRGISSGNAGGTNKPGFCGRRCRTLTTRYPLAPVCPPPALLIVLPPVVPVSSVRHHCLQGNVVLGLAIFFFFCLESLTAPTPYFNTSALPPKTQLKTRLQLNLYPCTRPASQPHEIPHVRRLPPGSPCVPCSKPPIGPVRLPVDSISR